MNREAKEKKLVISLVFAAVFFMFGIACLSLLVDKFMNIPSYYASELGRKVYLPTNRFQPGAVFTVLGCISITFSNLLFFNILETMEYRKSDRYHMLGWSKLPMFALYVIYLNLYSCQYFFEMAAFYLRNHGGDEALLRYNSFTVRISEVFLVLLVLILLYNTHREKIKWFGTVVSLLAIAQSCAGIVMRTFTVKWLWGIYLLGAIVMFGIILLASSFEKAGLSEEMMDEGTELRYAFFISDHGFGHMMRNIAVIKELLERGYYVLMVCGEKQLDAAGRYLAEEFGMSMEEFVKKYKTDAEVMQTDFGLKVMDGSLRLDITAICDGLEKFEKDMEYNTEYAMKLLLDKRISRVVSDICPWALTAAEECGIRSYLMASFTWIEIYEEYFPEELIKPLRECYEKADRAIIYSLANKNTRARFYYEKEAGYCARPVHEDRVREIRERYAGDRKLVFVSIGLSNSGIDLGCDVEELPYIFIITKGINLTGSNVVDLGDTCPNTQDYVAAADYCIIKSGWTTIAECMIAGKPMALIGRPDVAEDRMSIEMLKEMQCGIEIGISELGDMAAVMKKMEEYEWKNKPHENSYKKIADILTE